MKYYINHIGYCGRDDSSDYLAHYGIKGMKWDPRKLKRRYDIDNARKVGKQLRKDFTNTDENFKFRDFYDKDTYLKARETKGKPGTRLWDNTAGNMATEVYNSVHSMSRLAANGGYADDHYYPGGHYAYLASSDRKKSLYKKVKDSQGRVKKMAKNTGKGISSAINSVSKKKQSVSLDALKKRKKLYNSWSKK